MADIDKLSDEIKLVPNDGAERQRARLPVAEHYLGDPDARTATGLHMMLDMLGLFPSQAEYAPRYLSRGQLTNSTMIQTSDARRRAGR